MASFVVPIAMPAKAHAQSAITLNGAGATFPFPLIDTWRVEYNKLNPNVQLNYQSIGSGGGIKQFTEKTVDFGATDAPLTQAQFDAAPGAIHIPETIGSVVPTYNIPGIGNGELKLTGTVLADIFLGKITKWDDPAIKNLNQDLALPSEDIIVVHRSDGSGTTYVWTDYLSKASPEWEAQIGKGTSVPWPVGLGGPGNEGVANLVRQTTNAIGYNELAYAITTGMSHAQVQNREGNFIHASLETVRNAVAAESISLPAGDAPWHTVTMTNARGADSYPIASFSYLLVYKELSTFPSINSMARAKALVDFIHWAITDGQEFAPPLEYVPLPDEVVNHNLETLQMLTYNGEPVFEAPGQQAPATEPFTISYTLGGNTYTITGVSEEAKATSFRINPEQSIEVQLQGQGEIELTLPKSMVDGISTIRAGDQEIPYQQVSSSSSETTIRFTVPEGTDSVDIQAAMVVPEFEVIALLILAASIVAAIVIARVVMPGQSRSNNELAAFGASP
ncbi:phosphate ABC transporter substrate-binding protein PstS [Candidatus Nitrososphaera gargensis]|uniref:phosphate ABC transporter substrate-binding protein PstS n=1 Tax=Candidatus Nitrososphaera gargensis TaxID=497727 RepID=UPI001E29F3A8|nr:phosphate ABC transporter substrate-binding protein PstS [Candidatus Nitrososphaera gargensis]